MKTIVRAFALVSAFIWAIALGAGPVQAEDPGEAEVEAEAVDAFTESVATRKKATKAALRQAEIALALDDEAQRSGEAPGGMSPEDAEDIIHSASTAYLERRDYLRALEMAEGVIEKIPEHKEANELQETILHDLEDHVSFFPKDQAYELPEGIAAYKVAVSDGILTVNEAVKIALRSNVKLAGLRKKIVGAEGKILEARRAFYPTLTGEISVNGGIVGTSAYTGERFLLNASQPIFYGGELIYTLRQTEANLASDKAKYTKERLGVVRRAKESYYGVVKADYNMSYQAALLQEVTDVKETIVKAHEKKLVSAVDHLEVVAIYYQVFATNESAINDYQSADLLFHQVLGLGPEDPAPISTGLNYEDIPIDLDEVRLLAQKNNPDIIIKQAAVNGAYYGLKVYDAKKLPRVDLRGSAGLSGEIEVESGTSPDVEREWSLFLDASMPWGASTAKYGFRRRKFGPTILDVTGSEDFKHTMSLSFLDNFADVTDRELAIATYLEAKDELEEEQMGVDINARDFFYSYHQALISIDTSLARLEYLEKQVNVLKTLVEIEEARTPDLLDEMTALAEERFAYVRSVTDLYVAVSNINTIVGDADYLVMAGS